MQVIRYTISMKKIFAWAYVVLFGISILVGAGFLLGYNLHIVLTIMGIIGAISVLSILFFMLERAVSTIWGDEK
jgi:hypothetical protein